MIGFAFDGTGYGTDGAVWGGEVLVAAYKSFRRAAHLGYVPLAGGDASVPRPYRMALAHLRAAGVDWTDDLPAGRGVPRTGAVACSRTSSTPASAACRPPAWAGSSTRSSSLVGVRHVVDYEAEAAIELESLARSYARRRQPYAFGIAAGAGRRVATRPGGPGRRGRRTPRRCPAARWRRGSTPGVAALVVDLADRERASRPGSTWWRSAAACSERAAARRDACGCCEERGFTVLRPRLLPPNDGGIALGQILVGSAG